MSDFSRGTKLSPIADPIVLLDELDAKHQLDLKDRALSSTAEGVTISDPNQPDHPIVYANEAFELLTGYSREEAVGRNCRFLQGAETDQNTVDEIRRAVRQKMPVTVELLNYRKDGSEFWNRLSITPIVNSAGDVTHYIGVQSDVTGRRENEAALRQANESLEESRARMKNDLEAAARLQRSLLPSAVPEFDRIEIRWTFRPCDELAGDFINVIPLDDDHVAIYVVDVTGHGVAASLLSVAIARSLTSRVSSSSILVRKDKASGHRIVTPGEVAKELNRCFPMEEQNGLSFTMLYGVLDLQTFEYRYISAGHDPIIVITESGQSYVPKVSGLTIGWVEDAQFKEHRVQLSPGDRFYLYSDGIPEAMNSELNQFTRDRAVDHLVVSHRDSLEQSVKELASRVEDWCGRRGPLDDVSLLGVEIRKPSQ